MKHKFLITTLFILLPLLTFAQSSSLTIRNNTGKEVRAAYAYYDSKEQAYISRGWYNIKAYQSQTIARFNNPSMVYIHAETGILIEKSTRGNRIFCVDNWKAFTIYNSDRVKCKARKEFSEFQLDAGNNTWTVNP